MKTLDNTVGSATTRKIKNKLPIIVPNEATSATPGTSMNQNSFHALTSPLHARAQNPGCGGVTADAGWPIDHGPSALSCASYASRAVGLVSV